MGKSWIIVGCTIVLVIASLILIIGYQPIDSAQQSMPESWMFKGAYATYEGQIESLSIPCSIDAKIQVTDLNATHIQIRTDSTIATTFTPTLTDQTIYWVNKTNINFQPKGETLAKTYNTTINVNNIGNRDCIAYDYTNEAINATYYIDKDLQWPLRIVYTTAFENQTYTIEFNLKDSNINGL